MRFKKGDKVMVVYDYDKINVFFFELLHPDGIEPFLWKCRWLQADMTRYKYVAKEHQFEVMTYEI